MKDSSTKTECLKNSPICPICKNNPVELTEGGKLRICLECKEDKQRENKIGSRHRNITQVLKTAGVPTRYLSACIKRQETPNMGSGIFLQGAKGTGKTHLACGYLKEYALQGKSIRFVTSPDLFLSIRGEAFDKGESEDEVINRWKKTQVLVLDDLGTEKMSEWVYSTMYAILDYRYREMLITIITSNYTKDKLEKKIGERLVSRFYEMCTTITLKGRDRRMNK